MCVQALSDYGKRTALSGTEPRHALRLDLTSTMTRRAGLRIRRTTQGHLSSDGDCCVPYEFPNDIGGQARSRGPLQWQSDDDDFEAVTWVPGTTILRRVRESNENRRPKQAMNTTHHENYTLPAEDAPKYTQDWCRSL